MKKNIAISILVVGLLFSCNKQMDSAMKSTDKNFILSTANQFYEKKNWTNALALYDRLPNLVSGTDDSPEVLFKSAFANYYSKNYRLAAHQFKNFEVSFPNDPRKEESAYMSALCYYEGSLDYDLDQESTESAINELQSFIDNYPNSERNKNINKLIEELNYKLEFKYYEHARRYFKIGEYKSAVISFENLLDNFPGTPLKNQAYSFIMKAKAELSLNSIYILKKDRLENAIAFTRQVEKDFPKSAIAKEAITIRQKLNKEKERHENLIKEIEQRNPKSS